MALDKLSGNSFATGAIANSLGYTPANKAGDTFTGAVTISNTFTVSGATTLNNDVTINNGSGTTTLLFQNNGGYDFSIKSNAGNSLDFLSPEYSSSLPGLSISNALNSTFNGSVTIANNTLRITKTGTYPGGYVFNHNPGNNIASLSVRDASDTSYNTLYLEAKDVYIKSNAAANDLYISNTEVTSLRRFKAPSLVSSGGYGNNAPHGYWNYNDGGTSVSIPNNSAVTTLGTTTFTIPSTAGVSTWRVVALTSWTGQQPGYRLWTWVTLNDSSGTSNSTNPNSSGFSEHSWGESDLSVGAYSWLQHAVWENIASGTHTLRIQANSTAGGSCWRRGAAIFWFPSS